MKYKNIAIETSCNICGVKIKGILLTKQALAYLDLKAEEPSIKHEIIWEKPIGYSCAKCAFVWCMDDYHKIKIHWYYGLEKKPCPRCSEPMKGISVIIPEPCPAFRALIEREIDRLLDPEFLAANSSYESLGEMLKRQGKELVDAIKAPRPEFKIPGKAPFLDLWPGRCTACGAETDQPDISVRYSYRWEGKYLGRRGVEKLYEYSILDVREHPMRYCTACNKTAHSLRDFVDSPSKKVDSRIYDARANSLKTENIRVVGSYEDIK